MLALKTGERCPNAAFNQKACDKVCEGCPFKRPSWEFLTAYGPTRIYVGKNIHYCGLDAGSLKVPKGVKIDFIGKGISRRAVIPENKLNFFRTSQI